MSLRLRLGLSFALVAATTSLVMVLATPVVIRYGFEPVIPPPAPAPAESGIPTPSSEASSSAGPGSPVAGTPGPSDGPIAGPTGGASSPRVSDTASPPGPSLPPPTATPRPGGSAPSSARPSRSPQPTGSAVQSGRPSQGPGGPGGAGGGATRSPKTDVLPGGSAQPKSGHGESASAGPGAVLTAARVHEAARPDEDVVASAPASQGQPSASASPDPANLAWVEVERRTSSILAVVAALSAVVSIAIGLVLAEALIRPLRDLGKAASAIAGGDLTRRSGVGDRNDEIGELGRSFDTMAVALEQADTSRRRFLQDAAHELGTPVTAIQTIASAILDGVYEPERRHLATIRDEARLLGRIVDDLRTIALAEVHQLPMQAIRVDVAAIAASTTAGFEAAATTGGRQVTDEGAPGAVVTGDPDRIRQVIAALVDNALRHVPEGGEVRVLTTVGGGQVRVDVEDDGPGLGDHPNLVFDRFYRGGASPDRTAGHAGLGLAIVRALVEAHGGRVSARNRPNGGAAFRVELPAADRAGLPDTPDETIASDANGEPPVSGRR